MWVQAHSTSRIPGSILALGYAPALTYIGIIAVEGSHRCFVRSVIVKLHPVGGRAQHADILHTVIYECMASRHMSMRLRTKSASGLVEH